jgi:hypothetical protein
MFSHTTAIFYITALIVCIVAVYYINTIYNAPQPYVNVTYNYSATAQYGIGYINNTLPYPIEITSIYCTLPNGTREVFGNPNNNILVRGSNTVIDIQVNNLNVPLHKNCTKWKVGFDELPANAVPPNAIVKVTVRNAT